MDDEANHPASKTAIMPGMDLSTLSIDELQEAIAHYQREIARLEETIESKNKGRLTAESFFKS